ncbi:MAG: single-stranded-DNA-specific exonuclease RecJ [Desulfobacteraceae bacterium]|jgi:single-stranded-DNA-specific exonuclease
MQMQWKILQPDPKKVKAIQAHLNCHPITATVIANRNITSPLQANDFINPTLDTLSSPMGLNGMAAATQRILHALKTDEKILIFGDYDADGVTAAALLFQFLRSAGADVMVHLPHRIEEGYGLQAKHINQLAVPRGIGLIITVDCGSGSHEAVDAAKRFGIDVIITDHHNYESLPDAHAVINPKMSDQPQDLAGLAGVGVAFYLAIGLRMLLRENGWWNRHDEPRLIDYCDLVAIGTIADMVPLTDANRVFAKAGIKQINASPRPGVEALCRVCKINPELLSSEDIAFRLAPRVNAAGRIAHAQTALELLNSEKAFAAHELAEILSGLNQRRQEIERQIFNAIVERVEGRNDLLKRKTLLLADERWHQGVLGIVASRLTARYHRPVVLLGIQNGMGKGSGRSIAQLDLFEALRRCEHLLEQYGGHRLAAGLSVRTENIRKLQAAFEEAVSRLGGLSEKAPDLVIDCEIQFNQINPQLLDELKNLEPFGTDNPAPIFAAKDIYVSSAAMVGKCHRRMSVRQPSNNSTCIDAIQFNLAPDSPRAERFDHLAFRLQWNQYRGQKRIQIVVEDF